MGASLLASLAIVVWANSQKTASKNIVWGLTYSPQDAQNLHLDTKQTYLSILDELKPKKLRIVAYWNHIEGSENNFDYSELDFETKEASKRHIPYVVVVGQRVPRYPECYIPDWASKLGHAGTEAKLLRFIQTTVERYNADPNLSAWQIENEATLGTFGVCPKFDEAQLKKEIILMRSLTNKELVMTDSGELSLWVVNSRYSDTFGTTLYRSVLNGRGNGVFHHFIPPFAYTLRAAITKAFHPNVTKVVVAELQAEPWGAKALIDESKARYDLTMNHTQFERNVAFARDTGAAEVWLWGTEWWYYEKLHGDIYFWDRAAQLYRDSAR